MRGFLENCKENLKKFCQLLNFTWVLEPANFNPSTLNLKDAWGYFKGVLGKNLKEIKISSSYKPAETTWKTQGTTWGPSSFFEEHSRVPYWVSVVGLYFITLEPLPFTKLFTDIRLTIELLKLQRNQLGDGFPSTWHVMLISSFRSAPYTRCWFVRQTGSSRKKKLKTWY